MVDEMSSKDDQIWVVQESKGTLRDDTRYNPRPNALQDVLTETQFQQLLSEIDHVVTDWGSVGSVRGAQFGGVYFGRPMLVSLLLHALSIVPSLIAKAVA